jgi:hypothetical protein
MLGLKCNPLCRRQVPVIGVFIAFFIKSLPQLPRIPEIHFAPKLRRVFVFFGLLRVKDVYSEES